MVISYFIPPRFNCHGLIQNGVQTEFGEPRVLEGELEMIFKPIEQLQTQEVNRTQFL